MELYLGVDGSSPGCPVVNTRRPWKGGSVTAAGEGVIVEQRLYQLVRQQGAVAERTFKIRFLDPGVEVFAFTLG